MRSLTFRSRRTALHSLGLFLFYLFESRKTHDNLKYFPSSSTVELIIKLGVSDSRPSQDIAQRVATNGARSCLRKLRKATSAESTAATRLFDFTSRNGSYFLPTVQNDPVYSGHAMKICVTAYDHQLTGLWHVSQSIDDSIQPVLVLINSMALPLRFVKCRVLRSQVFPVIK